MKTRSSTEQVTICHSLSEFEETTVQEKKKRSINPWFLLGIKFVAFITVGIISIVYKTFPAYIAMMAMAIIVIFSFLEMLFQSYKALFSREKDENNNQFKILYLKTYQFVFLMISYIILNLWL